MNLRDPEDVFADLWGDSGEVATTLRDPEDVFRDLWGTQPEPLSLDLALAEPEGPRVPYAGGPSFTPTPARMTLEPPERRPLWQPEGPPSVVAESTYAAQPAPAPPDEGTAIGRGFIRTMAQQNPRAVAGGLEVVSHLLPEYGPMSGWRSMLQNASQGLRDLAEEKVPSRQGPQRLTEIQDLEGALAWAGETAGEGLASTVPSIVTGAVGAAVGLAGGGPLAAAVGARLGAAAPSYLLNTGDLYEALQAEGASPEEAATWAAGGGALVTFFDVAGLQGMFRGATKPLRDRAIKAIAKRILQDGGVGALWEGSTEAIQSLIELETIQEATGKAATPAERREAVVSSAIGGALVGGPVGAAASVGGAGLAHRDAPASQEERIGLVRRLQGVGEKPVQWIRQAFGKRPGELTKGDLEMAEAMMPTEEQQAEESRAEAPTGLLAPPRPPKGAQRRLLPAESPPAEQEAQVPPAVPEAVPEPVRPTVRESPVNIEVAYSSGSRGPKDAQLALHEARFRFRKNREGNMVWQAAMEGAGVTEEIRTRRRALAAHLAGLETGTAPLGEATGKGEPAVGVVAPAEEPAAVPATLGEQAGGIGVRATPRSGEAVAGPPEPEAAVSTPERAGGRDLGVPTAEEPRMEAAMVEPPRVGETATPAVTEVSTPKQPRGIIAYKERESQDPETGEVGILRDEWRIREAGSKTGPDYNTVREGLGEAAAMRGRFVLEHRYIRRGKEESWEMFDAYKTRKDAISDVDVQAVAVTKDLQEIQEQRIATRTAEEAAAAQKAAEQDNLEKERAAEAAGQAAFLRLKESKDAVWTDRWNEFMDVHRDDPEFVKAAQEDEGFMRLYKDAVAAATVPKKRAAIKRFLAYAEGEGAGGAYATPQQDEPVTSRQPQRARAPLTSLSTNQPEIIKSLEKVVEAAGRIVPIRIGKIAQRNAAGIFKVQPEIVRLRQANDVPTAAHEIAHALEKALMGYEKGGPWRAPRATGEMQRELGRLGRELYGNRSPNAGYKREGWAQFVMYWLTDEQTARAKAPEVTRWFESEFLKNKEVADALADSKAQIGEWYGATEPQRIGASIVRPKTIRQRIAKFPEALRRAKRSLVFNWVEMGTDLDRLVRAAETETGEKLRPSEDPYKLFSAYRGIHGRVVRYMVEDGMLDVVGNKVGAPLKDVAALAKQSGGEEVFNIYMKARRARALLTDPKGPRKPGVALKDALATIADFEAPQLQLAASKYYEWEDGVLNYFAGASPTYAEIVRRFRERDPGDYISLMREFEDDADQAGRVGSGLHGAPVGRLKGSGRRTFGTFETAILNADRFVRAAHKRMVLDAVIRLSNVEGMGRFVEELPRSKLPKQFQVDHVKLLREIADQTGLDLSGIEETELRMVSLTFFEPKTIPGMGENIVPVQTESGVKWYEVDPDLYDILQGMDVYELPKVVDLLVGAPARWMRAGTTGLQAGFALITNPMRDPQSMMVNSRAHANAPRLFGSWLASMADATVSKAGHKSEWFDTYQRLGIEMAQTLGQDIEQTTRAARQLFQGRTVRTFDPRNYMDFYRELIQFPEAAPRLAEMKQVAGEVGWTPGERMTLDQAVELRLAGRQVTTDFMAGGRLSRMVNRMVPFHNAAIQGPRVTLRRLKEDPRKVIWRALTTITVPTLAMWWLIKDEEWYRELDYRELFLFWHVPLGDEPDDPIARIPRAFDIGAVFAALPEALLNAWYLDEPDTVKRWFSHLGHVTIPPVLPVLAEEVVEQAANWDFFWEKHIVPLGEARYVPEAEQFNDYTTRAAIAIGRTLNLSPRRVDHAIRGVFGGLGADIASAFGRGETDKAGAEREGELSDLTVLGRLFLRGGKAVSYPRSAEKLYDMAEEAQQRQNSRRNPETEAQAQQRLMLNDAARAVSLLLRMRASTPSAKARAQLALEVRDLAQDAIAQAASVTTEEGRRRFAETREDIERRWELSDPEQLDDDEKRRAVAWHRAMWTVGEDKETAREAILKLTGGDPMAYESQLRSTPAPTKTQPGRTAWKLYVENVRDYRKKLKERRN